MTTTQAALLDALTEILELCAIGDVDESTEALGWGVAIQRARAALRAADAAQGQEPPPGQSPCDVPGMCAKMNRKCDVCDPSLPTDTAPQPPAPIAAQPDAPTIEAAHDMGAKGGPTVEAERLAFEAWMRGHCWALCATWTGTQYRSDAEKCGDVDPRAMRTRQLWAAWRDRAALAAQAGPAQAPLTDEQIADAATSVKPYPTELVQVPAAQLVAFTRAVERRLAIAAQAPASTRPADASISGRRVDMLPSGWREIVEQLIACHDEPTCPAVAVAKEWLAAAPQAPAEPAAQAVTHTSKQYLALRERREYFEASAFFDAKPELDFGNARTVFSAGFVRGFNAGFSVHAEPPAAREAGTTAGN